METTIKMISRGKKNICQIVVTIGDVIDQTKNIKITIAIAQIIPSIFDSINSKLKKFLN